MRIARRRHLITIQTKKEVQDSYGEKDVTWEDNIIDYWAEVLPFRGREYHIARQTKNSITHKITMRYTDLSDGTKIKPSNSRVKFGEDRFFNIISVINLEERDVELELMCIEEV